MRKNGSKSISLNQYRLTDLFLFLLIMAVGEVLSHFALVHFASKTITYSVTFLLPITLIVMMRWGWQGILFAAADGLLFCILNSAGWQTYILYAVGNMAIAAMYGVLRLVGKKRIAGRWFFSLLFVVGGWLCVALGRSLIGLCFGQNFISSLLYCIGLGDTGLMSLALAIIIVLVLRRFDGMWEDQKSYLLRLDSERKEKMRRDEFGDEHIEIDEETLSILNKKNDLY